MLHKTEMTENPVFKELLETEKSYNGSLNLLLLSLIVILEFEPSKATPFFESLNYLVKDLIKVSDDLCSNAETSLKNMDNPETRQTLRSQRTQHLNEFFKLYKTYGELHKQYIKLAENPELFKQINHYLADNAQVNFDSHIIMPIQRGVRYLLLVKELHKKSESFDEFNQEEITQVEQMIEEHLSVYKNLMTPSKKPYQFGDYTRWFLGLDKDKQNHTESKNESGASEGYHFGDISRGLIRILRKKMSTAVPHVSTTPAESGNGHNEMKEEQPKAEKIAHQSMETVAPAYKVGALLHKHLWETNNSSTNSEVTSLKKPSIP